MKAFVVLTAVPDARTARRLAKRLLDEKVAACVTCAGGGFSMYRWKGKLETAKESLLLVKTSGARLKRTMRLIEETHPYELPEILVLPAEGSKRYLDWLHKSVR